MKTIVTDTETNAFKNPRIAQLSYIVLNESGNVIRTVNRYFDLDFMSDGAKEVHGLSLAKLKRLSQGVKFKDVAYDLYMDFKDSLIVGHNISFDMRVLNGEFKEALGVTLDSETFCTMKYYKDILKLPTKTKAYKQPKLKEVIDFLQVNEDDAMRICSKLYKSKEIGYHDARFDTTATLIIYKKAQQMMQEEKIGLGIETT